MPQMMAEIAAVEVLKSGARMFEFKVGVHSLACEIAIVRAIRAALATEVEIAIDANMGYDLDDARRFLDRVADLGLGNFEEPVARLADLARLRREYPVPVSSHCTDLDALAPYPEIDAIVPDLHLQGGIDGTVELIANASASGRRTWLRSMWELGISWAAMVHLGMARPELDRPAQSLINWVTDDLILGATWLPRDGGVRPPDRPGLGVELDRNALARYALG